LKNPDGNFHRGFLFSFLLSVDYDGLMVEKVKAPVVPITPQTTTPTEAAAAPAVKGTGKTPLDAAAADALQKAAQGLLSYKSSPLGSGAYKIFSDGVVLPSHLIDTHDPRNDPKYLRLLAAIFGLDDLERYFHTLTEEQEAERKVKRESEREEKEREGEESSEEDPTDAESE
jgi:hypothetical protein